MRIIINYVIKSADPDLYRRQNIALKSWKKLYEKEKPGIKFTFIQNEGDDLSFIKFPFEIKRVTRNAFTVLGYEEKPSLFLRDIFNAEQPDSNNYLTYINSDVILKDNFLEIIKNKMPDYDIIGITVSRLPNHINSYEEAVSEKPYLSNMGFQGFVFNEYSYKKIMDNFPDYLVGEFKWDIWMNNFISKNMKMYHDHETALHIEHPVFWNKNTPLRIYNKKIS